MLASLAITLASAVFATAQSSSGLTINTPTSVVECQPVALSWNGGSAPYFVSIIPGGQAGATPIESFPTQTGTSYTWNADIAAGTSITFQVKDSTGAINYSQQVSVQQGTSTSCVGQGSSGSSAAAGGAGGAGSSSAAAAPSSAAGGATTSAAATSRAASSASSAAGGAGSKASSAAGAATSAAGSATSAAASAGSSSTSDATKIGAGLFTVAAGAFFAIFA